MSSDSSRAAARLAATTRHLSGGAPSGSASGSLQTQATIKNVTIIGAGLMGAGVAQVALQSGLKVTLCDVSPQALKVGKGTIVKSLTKHSKKKYTEPLEQERFVNQVLEGLKTSTDPVTAAVESDSDLVIEAIIENLKIKQELFEKLDKATKSSCILVTNTSSLPVTSIGLKLSAERRERYGGLHFFNPVPAMKLVEVVRTAETSNETFDRLFAFSKAIGKVPVACKDTPGFIVNRLLIPYMRDAMKMLERGDASAKDIDIAMKLGAGYPMGPLELSDLVGLDTSKAIGDGWKKLLEEGDERIPKDAAEPIKLLNKLVAEGKLGMKSGEGFHKYK